ncbi:uracil-DNA glycosylase [Marinomonas sp. M1K-6]|uniref:Uracil-DNA glycosylase n=1 Tax=Marinomonas profundi TaxID=2726122 RepID=A0A847QZT6_9GAMM|nr:uracil-DNA glycosylase [Marinomonas profundi]NLQ18959.1 uracil-DNA glycosylase [Marinomonas profundi]UDV02302.1 uracil-DNA glycosylase [Marinomonas profundi]
MTLTGDWQDYLADEFAQDYMLALQAFLQSEQQHKTLYPAEPEYFAALNATPFSQVKVVILGQDPYHGEGQAHGLSFSVKPNIKVPPSLVNIYKELEMDLGIVPAQHGFLGQWAEQGVLLLNSVLTVEAGKAGSHQNKGWEIFTDKIIALINQHHQGVVFMLWGAYAQKKGRHIDRHQHCVLESVHPSPLSAYRGFLGCQHFSKANDYLTTLGKTPIQWALKGVDDNMAHAEQKAQIPLF